jgi:hypothetical protein
MLTEQEVQSIVAAYVRSIKPFYNDGMIRKGGRKGYNSPTTPWPEYWPGYNDAVKHRDELRVHIEYGVYPEHLFKARAPHQTQEEHEYAKANFKQVTVPEYADFENTILRALHESNWSLTPGDRAGDVNDELSWNHYVTRRIEHFGSVAEYFKHIIPKIKTLDPMGVICVMPERLPTVERTQEDGTTIAVIDPDSLVDPQPIYFPVDMVVGKQDERWYLLRRREYSTVTKAGKDAEEGIVLWLVDDTNCYRIYQTGKAHDLTFEVSLYFQHDTGYVPAEPLKGRPVLKDGAVIHESFYMPAKDLLDLVLMDSANLTAIKAASVYPQKVMIGNECDFRDARTGDVCNGGRLQHFSEDGSIVMGGTCKQCNGTGLAVTLGPNKVLLVRAPSQRDASGTTMKVQDAMTYVEPSAGTTDTLTKQIESNRMAARRQLHLYSEPMSGGDAVTATQVGVGVKAQNAFIAPIASQIFGTMDFVLSTITVQRYGERDGYYDLIPATQYDLRTEADYVAMLGEAQAKGLPPSAIEEILRGFFAARYGSDPYMAEAFAVIATADTLLTTNWQQIQAMQGKNQVQAWEVVLHSRALTLYDEMMRDPGFRDLEPFEKAARLQERAKELTQAESPAPAQGTETPAQRALRLVQGTEEEDRGMVDGVIDILRGIADMDNRRASAEERLADFAREGVTVDREAFLAEVMAA